MRIFLKPLPRRSTKLDEHLGQMETYYQHRDVYKEYKQLEPKKRGAFREKHAAEIERYESASRYLKDHLNGYGKIPENEWKTEREKLLAGRFARCDEYYKLRDDVKSLETLRRAAETIARGVTPERTPKKTPVRKWETR